MGIVFNTIRVGLVSFRDHSAFRLFSDNLIQYTPLRTPGRQRRVALVGCSFLFRSISFCRREGDLRDDSLDAIDQHVTP